MSDFKPVLIPLASKAYLTKLIKLNHEPVNLKLYQGMVGSIVFGMLLYILQFGISNRATVTVQVKPGKRIIESRKSISCYVFLLIDTPIG